MLSAAQKKIIDKRDNKVLSAVKSRKTGASFADLATKTKLEPNQIRGSLRRLRELRKIKASGERRTMKYFG